MTGTERSRRSRARHRPTPKSRPGPSLVRPERGTIDSAEHAVIQGVLDYADGHAQPQLCLYRLISQLMSAYQRRQGE